MPTVDVLSIVLLRRCNLFNSCSNWATNFPVRHWYVSTHTHTTHNKVTKCNYRKQAERNAILEFKRYNSYIMNIQFNTSGKGWGGTEERWHGFCCWGPTFLIHFQFPFRPLDWPTRQRAAIMWQASVAIVTVATSRWGCRKKARTTSFSLGYGLVFHGVRTA